MISDFKILKPNGAFETAELWCIVHLTTVFTKEKLHFSLIFIFYCGLVKKG